MTVDQLLLDLQRKVQTDIQPVYQRFREVSDRPDDVDAFLAFLHLQGHLDESVLGEFLDRQEVEVTLSIHDGQDPDQSPTDSMSDPHETVARVAAALSEVSPRHCGSCGEAIVGGTTPNILAELGAGAMGEIHIARDAELGRRVAYKRLKPDAAAHEIVVERFLSEAQITAQLDHPNIVPVYALVFDSDAGPAYTMKLVRGQTFKELIAELVARFDSGEPLEERHGLEARLEHFVKVCDAINYAHSKGVLHRDLKPANIMIGRYGEVYVMDWGIASVRGADGEGATARVAVPQISSGDSDEATATQEGQLVGTPAYMSPEQAHGHNAELDARSDQYSLGLILQQLVTLTRAIPGKSAREVLANVRLGSLEPIVHAFGEPIAPDLRAIVARARAHDRDKRYPDVGALADDIRRFLRGDAVRAHQYSKLERVQRYMAQHRMATLVVTMGALLVGASAMIWGLERSLEANRRETELRQAAHRRERQLGRFLSRVNHGARRIDAHFKHYEVLLVGYAASVRHALLHGEPSTERIYFDAEMIAAPEARPADMVHSAGYQRDISPTQLVVKMVTGADRTAVMPLVRKVIALRPTMRRIVLDSHPTQRHETAESGNRMLLAREQPLTWLYVGLEKGVHISFPAKYGYGPRYDPRKRPWYSLPHGKRGAVWGKPYIDVGGQGMVLPCTYEIRDDGGARLGVAAIDLTFDYLIEQLLALPDEAIIETYLVDDQGREIVRGSEKGLPVEIDLTGKQGKVPPPLSILPVREAIAEGKQDGVVSLATADGRRLASYSRLAAIGWYYVVLADPAKLTQE